ncbi:MAG TPA: hypothetical protein EYP10_05210, partial [Armatimonadetes bacterium]|nr:hypothetical protein [Armatimonadota bacterium]
RRSSDLITLTVALLSSATAMLMWILLKQKRLQCIIGIGIAMLPALLMVTNVNRLEGATVQMRWRSFGTGNELLKSIDSPYQNIAIGKRLEQYSVFCNGHFTLNFPDPYMNATLAKLLVSEADKPRSALIIGGGIEGLLTQLHLADVKTIHYVQIDPWLVRAIISFLPPSERMVLKRAGIKLFYTDARQFVYSTRERYDLIFLHLGDPSTALLNRYYTLEFFKLVREHLTDRGIFALHITASESYFGPGVAEYVASIYHTLKRAFPNIAIAVGETTYFFATRHRGLVSESPEELMRRVQWLGQSRTQDDSGAQLDSHTMRNSSIMDEFSVRTIPPEVLYAFFPPLRADWMREQLMLIRRRIGEERANRILLN